MPRVECEAIHRHLRLWMQAGRVLTVAGPSRRIKCLHFGFCKGERKCKGSRGDDAYF